MIFKQPLYLLLFIIYIPLIWWFLSGIRESHPSIGVSSLRAFKGQRQTWKGFAVNFCYILEMLTIGFLIVAIARPQTSSSKETSQVEGTDIALALDISASMGATDLQPNRYIAAKRVATEFVKGRVNDNMAIVAFGGESLSLVPLTNDRMTLINSIENIQMGQLDNGTAIGEGLASAINRLVSGQAKSKSIILLTDGSNNKGEVAPATAAEIAHDKGIRVYTIGVGTDQAMQITDPYGFSTTTMETKIDEETLKDIAKTTGGKYFRATDERMLANVFEEINRLEKSKIDVNHFSRLNENFFPWVLVALISFGLMLLIRYVLIRIIP